MPVARVLPLKPFWTFWGKSDEKINNLQGSGHGWGQAGVSLFSGQGFDTLDDLDITSPMGRVLYGET